MLDSNSFPGRERFICHAAREIINRLPDYLLQPKSNQHLDYSQLIDEIAGDWDKINLIDSGEMDENISISPSLYKKIDDLIQKHRKVSLTKKEKVCLLFVFLLKGKPAQKQLLRPAVEEWCKVSNWFVRQVHDSGTIDYVPPFQEVRIHFENLEYSLFSLVGKHYENIEVLDEILARANR